MDITANLNALLAALSTKAGLPGLAADEEGFCTLAFDESIQVNLQADAETGSLLIFSEIGRTPPEKALEVYGQLLEANCFWRGTGGATLSVAPDTAEILLQYQDSLVTMDFARFEQILEQFVNATEYWMKRLAEWQDAPTDPESSEDPAGMPTGVRV